MSRYLSLPIYIYIYIIIYNYCRINKLNLIATNSFMLLKKSSGNIYIYIYINIYIYTL